MYIVAYRLLNLLNDSEYNSTEFHIAEKLLDMLYEIEYMPIDQVAEKCHISKSTLSKFVKGLGFADYKGFRDSARNEKKRAGYRNYEQKFTMEGFVWEAGMESFIKVLSEDVLKFMDGINIMQIRKLAHAIYAHKKVVALGSVYSETVAIDFMYKLAKEGKYIKTNIDDTKQEMLIRDADEDTLIIIFSNSGQYIYEEEMNPLDKSRSWVRKTKGKVALITSNEEAALDNCVNYPVLYHFTSLVQNHPFVERLVVEVIIAEYTKIKKDRDIGNEL